ncbi:hypothetical protein NDU88_004681 [Pleurodeles waltl]|uniref:Uncharacterized protein n=1 Tax=Pleurodeles waltl TaxID=8319 RepID=A0AAV7UHQ5_PLEWA|nr:hypothetical protein NDU88_004681 [Pleurodeles waltl]
MLTRDFDKAVRGGAECPSFFKHRGFCLELCALDLAVLDRVGLCLPLLLLRLAFVDPQHHLVHTRRTEHRGDPFRGGKTHEEALAAAEVRGSRARALFEFPGGEVGA